jgi:hypothetical protein
MQEEIICLFEEISLNDVQICQILLYLSREYQAEYVLYNGKNLFLLPVGNEELVRLYLLSIIKALLPYRNSHSQNYCLFSKHV